MRRAAWAALLALAPLAACAGRAAPGGAGQVATPAGAATAAPAAVYRFLVGAESDDQVALAECRFGPVRGAAAASDGDPCAVVRTYPVGLIPADIEGPHGVIASPSGAVMYVSIAHGRPNGLLQKYSLESGRALGEVELGMFPATVDITPDGAQVWVINFNFDDPAMRPSSVSVVDAATMLELGRIQTCRMPHGSRLNPAGTRHYSGCMMDDLLVEVDVAERRMSRVLHVGTAGSERAVAPAELLARQGPGIDAQRAGIAPAAAAGAGAAPHAHEHIAEPVVCSPTWAQPSADGSRVYVACNRSAEIVEVDVADWRVVRRWSTPKAPYNLAVTPDGKLLVATQKGPGTTTVWRLSDARLLAEIPGTRTLASGVAVSADGRYAFVTLEGKGGDPGTVDVIDLERLARVASVETGKQAGGVAVLP